MVVLQSKQDRKRVLYTMELFSLLATTLTLLCISLLVNCEYVKNWNKCPIHTATERKLPGISVHECLKQCYIRKHCQLICYRTGSHLCEIYSSWEEISTCTRCVSIFREAIPGDQFGPSCDCEEGQTCNTLTGQCEYTECLQFSGSYRHIYGNVAYVGAKVRTRCHVEFMGNYTELMCHSNGNWKNKLACSDFCPLFGELVTVTDDFRMRILNQSTTQSEAKNNCSAIGERLLKMDQTFKLDAIRTITALCREYRGKGYWIDGYSETPTDLTTWTFSDGAPIPTDLWGQSPFKENTQCVRLKSYKNIGYMLMGMKCSDQFYYVCEAQ